MTFPHRERMRVRFAALIAEGRRAAAAETNAQVRGYLDRHVEALEKQLRHLESLGDRPITGGVPTRRELEEMN